MNRFARILVGFVVVATSVFGVAFSQMAFAANCVDNKNHSAITYCNWPKEWAEYKGYDMVTIGAGQMTEFFSDIFESGWMSQGAAYTGKYMIYSKHSSANQKETGGGPQYIFVKNLETGKSRTLSATSPDWWHIHSIWYDSTKNRFYVDSRRSDDTKNDACFEIVEDGSDFGFSLKKITPISSCGVAKPNDKYRSEGLVYQGSTLDQSNGKYNGYTYSVYWDPGVYTDNGVEYYNFSAQMYHYKRNNNAIVIRDKSGKVVKMLYIPRARVDGELEAASVDPEGNLYLTYAIKPASGDHKRKSATYKIEAEVFGNKEPEPEPEPTPVVPEPEPEPVEPEPVVPDEPEPVGPEPVVPDEPEPEPEPEEEPEDESEEESEEEPEPTPTSTPPATVNVCDNPNIVMPVKQAAGCLEAQPELVQIIVNILNAIVGILGLVCVGVMVYAGVIYMTSAGAPEKTKKAKNIILYAVIGLIVCTLAFAIVNFVISKIQ